MSTALLQELRYAISFKKQVDLLTALTAADMWSLRQTNTDIIQAQPINEDDSADLGKGVYPTATFPSHINAGGNFNGRLTMEAAAQIMLFGIGAATKATAGSGFKYTATEPILAVTGLQMPSATMVSQIRTGGSAITDKLLKGVCCEEFGLSFKQGPGRDNATFTSNWIGTGSYVRPSAITMPSPYAEHSLNAGNITTLTLIGFNYITNQRFINMDMKWKNNIRDTSSYYPGSGQQGGYQLRGRMRRGAPTITLSAQVECDSGSSEEDLLLSQTAGTGVIDIVGPTLGAGPEVYEIKITFHKLIPRATPIADADGIASYQVDYFCMQDSSTGLVTVEITCDKDAILTL